ncbi:MAG: efflux RND transporter periplasmic adaptor subunit [Gammaproteobacteria bacterium]
MKKRILLTLLGLVMTIAVLAAIKTLQIRALIAQGESFIPPPVTVTTSIAHKEQWESIITGVGTLEAVAGTTLTAELSGKVIRINFESGTAVKKGDVLVQQDISTERAQMNESTASQTLAKLNLQRLKKLLKSKAVSLSEYDTADAQYKESIARSENIRSLMNKKTIRAPFDGKLGIRQINLGEELDKGEAIVSLQSLEFVFANFFLPQKQLARVKPGYPVRISSDILPGQVIEGKITAINPEANAKTRNIQLQASIKNTANLDLLPGMFVTVNVVLPDADDVLIIPATSLLFAPYGDSVFIVEKKEDSESLTARQQFVRIGKMRGDFVSIVDGLNVDETIVSTGAFKLRNGQSVVVDNTLAPQFELMPVPADN